MRLVIYDFTGWDPERDTWVQADDAIPSQPLDRVLDVLHRRPGARRQEQGVQGDIGAS
jgi:hypothetical protein